MAMKIVSAVLKVLEIIVLVAGLGVVGFFLKEVHDVATENDPEIDPYDRGDYGRYEFYLYATSVGVIIGIIGLVAVLTGMIEKNCGALTMVVVHALWALQLLVASALLATVLATHQKEVKAWAEKSRCDIWEDAETDYQCSHIMGGVICGFLATVLFIVDTVVYFISSKKSAAPVS